MERNDVNFKEDFDIPVPSELREIIDDIIRTFKERSLKKSKEFKKFDVVPFKIDINIDFEASKVLGWKWPT